MSAAKSRQEQGNGYMRSNESGRKLIENPPLDTLMAISLQLLCHRCCSFASMSKLRIKHNKLRSKRFRYFFLRRTFLAKAKLEANILLILVVKFGQIQQTVIRLIT